MVGLTALTARAVPAEAPLSLVGFNIPASLAEQGLRLFVRQAGVEAVFEVEEVRGSQTNAVEGRFTPRSALEALVAGTGLVVLQDEQTGAMAVRAACRATVPEKTKPQNHPSKTDMKPPKTLRRTLVALFLTFAASHLPAQTAAPTKAPKTDSTAVDETELEETVVLSPFVVTAEDSVGYQATNTLAGTRLRSSLKDIASPISVLTSELLKDVAATNIQQAMLYAINVENEDEYAPDDTSGHSISSTTQTRVRSLANATHTRGFFKTLFRADMYNTDRITVASGPNSILFGIGSPSGVIDATSTMASFAKNFGHVTFHVDSFGGTRVNGDYNAVLVRNKLAVRVAALDQKWKTFREPEFDDENRSFVSFIAKPFRGTTIRGEYESMKNHRVHARHSLMDDNVTDWIALGKPIYRYDTDEWSVDGGETWARKPELDSWRNRDVLAAGMPGNGRVYMAGGAIGGPEIQGLRLFDIGQSFPRWRPHGSTFSDDKLVSSKINYYGLGDRTFLGGESSNLFLEQRITHDLHLELAWRLEQNTRRQDDPVRHGQASIQADVNYFMYDTNKPPGAPLVTNPNVGRYYIQSEYLGWHQDHDLETARAMLNYNLDFTKGDRAAWLGKYTFGLMWQKERTDFLSIKERLVNREDYWLPPPLFREANIIHSRYYLDIPGFGGDAAGVRYPGDFVMPPWPAAVAGVMEDGKPSISRTDITSLQGVVQASLLKDSLVLTYGLRRDRQKVVKATITEEGHDHYDPYPVADLDPLTTIVQKGDTSTFGAVYHTPLKWLSLTYSRSNAFNPQGYYIDWYNQPLSPGTGVGEDVGLKFSLIDNKLAFNISRFSNTATNMIEFDWYYEEPKDSVVKYMDDGWGQVSNLARRLAETTGDPSYLNDIHEVNKPANFAWENAVGTRDYKSTGYEAELFYTPTPQFDVRLTASFSKATNRKINPGLQQYVADRLPIWEKYYGYREIPPWGAPEWKDDWRTNPDTVGWKMLNEGWRLARVEEFKASEGSVVRQGREWRVNLITNYRFEGGALRNFAVGGAVRYRSPDLVGYYGKPNPIGGTVPVADLAKPIYAKDSLDIDAWVNYKRKFKFAGHETEWNINLNVRNLFNNDKFSPLWHWYDGQPLAWTRRNPVSYHLSNTFYF